MIKKGQDNVKQIGIILDDLIKKKRWQKTFALARLCKDWEGVVGMNIAKHTNPTFIKSKKLFIEVDSPIWSTQLTYLKNQIIETINTYYEQEIVKDIFFTVKKNIKKK